MATFREIQANFRANAQSLKRTLRGIKSEMGSMKSETEKVSQSSQKAYGRMADGTKVYRNAQGQLQTELGKTVTASQVAAREGGRTEQVWHNISSGLDTASRGVQSFSTRLQGIGGGLVSFGSTLTRNVTMPLVGLATALGGTALVKGFNRLVGIDTAQAKLKALGHDGEAVEGIMNSANESVLGTSFGLDEAATIAASAVAAGVETGSELTKYLTTTGDAAAIAGTSLDEMGSIFNKVQTSGKAYNSELQMLSERGLPIYTWLAEEANTTEDAIFDMASQGKISTEMFLSAVENNIGGAAAVMGEESFTAALANMWAAVGRLGASFLEGGEKGEGFFHQMKPILEELTEGFDNMGDVAAVWGEKFGAAFATFIDWIRQTIDWFRKKESWFQALVVAFGVFMSAIGPILLILGKLIMGIASVGSSIGVVLGWFSKLTGSISSAGGLISWLGIGIRALAGRFSFLLGPIGIVIGVITTLASVFMYAYNNSEPFKNFIDGLVQSFKDGINWIKDFGKAISGIWSGDAFSQDGAMDLLYQLGLSEEQVAMVFDVVERIKGAYEGMKEKASENLEMIKQFFIDRFDQIKNWWDSTGSGIFDSLVETFGRVKDDVSNALSGIKDFFIGIFQDIQSWWASDGELIFDAVGTVFEGMQRRGERAWSILSKAVEIGIDIITGLIETFAPIVTGIFNTLWPIITYLTENAWEKIKLAIGIAMDLIMGIISGVAALIEGDWERFGEILKETAESIWNRVVEFFGNMKDNALELINDLTGGGIDKFIEMRDGAIEWVASLYDGVIEWWDNLKTSTDESVSGMVESVKQFFVDLWTNVTTKVSEIRDDVVSRFTELKDRVVAKVEEIFGPTIQTFQDIYNSVTEKVTEIRVTLTEIWNRIKAIITSVAQGIWTSVSEWFLRIYNNLTERITNLRIRLNEIWTRIRDRIVEIVMNLYNRVRDWFLNIYNNVTERINNLRIRLINLWNNIRDRVVGIVQNLYNRVRDWFLSIYNTVRDRTRSARNTAVNWFGSMRDRVIEIAKYIWEKVSGWFSSIYTAIHDKMRDAKNKAVEFAEDLYTGAKEQFESLVDASRDMMDGIGDWIDEKRSAVINKATALGRGIANAAIRGFNSLIGGINKVAEFLGAKTISKIPLLGSGGGSTRGVGAGYHAIRASKGLRDHKGGDVLVGDKGPGNSIGGGSSTREIVQLPDGKNFLMDGDVFLPNAPKGMKVHSNKDTEAILANNPQFNPDLTGGSGALNNMLRPVTRMLENQQTTAKVSHDVTSDIMAYADDPAQLAKDVIDQFTSFDLPKVPFDLAWAAVRNTTTAMGNKFKEWFDAFGSGGDGSHILGKKILQTFGLYRGNIGFNLGKHYGLDTAHKFDPLLSPVNGRVSRIWNDYGGGKSLQITTDKYIWWFMHLSNIMKRVGDTVKTGMRLGTTGNSGNYVVGSGHLHTQVHPRSKGAGNFNAIDPFPILKNLSGYFRGGITSGMPELAWLNEEGFRESIISHNPAHRERSQDIWSATGQSLGFGDNKEELALLREEIGLLKQIVKNTGDTADNTDVMKDKEPMGIGEFEKLRNKHLNKRML